MINRSLPNIKTYYEANACKYYFIALFNNMYEFKDGNSILPFSHKLILTQFCFLLCQFFLQSFIWLKLFDLILSCYGLIFLFRFRPFGCFFVVKPLPPIYRNASEILVVDKLNFHGLFSNLPRSLDLDDSQMLHPLEMIFILLAISSENF